MSDAVDYKAGETPMTDYQLRLLLELKDKCAAQERELEALRDGGAMPCSSGMTDYQFKQYEELRDQREAQSRKELIEAVYQLVRSNFKAGKSPEEILEALASLGEKPL